MGILGRVSRFCIYYCSCHLPMKTCQVPRYSRGKDHVFGCTEKYHFPFSETVCFQGFQKRKRYCFWLVHQKKRTSWCDFIHVSYTLKWFPWLLDSNRLIRIAPQIRVHVNLSMGGTRVIKHPLTLHILAHNCGTRVYQHSRPTDSNGTPNSADIYCTNRLPPLWCPRPRGRCPPISKNHYLS